MSSLCASLRNFFLSALWSGLRRGGLHRVLFIQLFKIGSDLLITVLEKILQLFLSNIPCLALHHLAFAPVNSKAFAPKEV